ncbi:hypothetical protein QFC24_004572 [Naganishia onofrii]|uniref:Uncharacterized protein n=1 Tax=Naganishia onofrii TaxID=1851511 RepID=A0ACC2XD59_9TREE|nr:hypothetical protein QFC24_004572 [Naganishia onofrii]
MLIGKQTNAVCCHCLHLAPTNWKLDKTTLSQAPPLPYHRIRNMSTSSAYPFPFAKRVVHSAYCQELMAKLVDKSPCFGKFQSESGAKVLHDYVDFSNAIYRWKVRRELQEGYRLLEKLKYKGQESGSILGLVKLLLQSLLEDPVEEETIIDRYVDILDHVNERDWAEKILIVVWEYIFAPLTASGALKRYEKLIQAGKDGDSDSTRSVSSQPSSNQVSNETTSSQGVAPSLEITQGPARNAAAAISAYRVTKERKGHRSWRGFGTAARMKSLLSRVESIDDPNPGESSFDTYLFSGKGTGTDGPPTTRQPPSTAGG